jgi:polycystin 1L2
LSNYSRASIAVSNSSNQTQVDSSIRSVFLGRIFSSACKYWNEKEKEWQTDGCLVGERTTYRTTECLCYHLTTFGSDFYVPPNTIDFGSVFGKFKSLSDNAAVFATVISILGVYVLIALFARFKDKKDLLKWGATPLEDNLPIDKYYYLISVQTGFGRDCGTKSNVGFVLSGEWADSGVRKLSDDKRNVISSNQFFSEKFHNNQRNVV